MQDWADFIMGKTFNIEFSSSSAQYLALRDISIEKESLRVYPQKESQVIQPPYWRSRLESKFGRNLK